MLINGETLNEHRLLKFRQRLKGILYVQRKTLIVPLESSQPPTRIRSTPEQCPSVADSDQFFSQVRLSTYSSGRSSTKSSGSSFLGSRTLSAASSRTSYSSDLGWPEDAKKKPYPVAQQKLEKNKPKKKYFCTHCPDNFSYRDDWKAHELRYHERETRYSCPECDWGSYTEASFKIHFRGAHRQKECPHPRTTAESVDVSRRRTAWGCGICSALLLNWEKRCDHVAAHCEAGFRRIDWCHSKVILGLLRQPVFAYAWEAYLLERHGNFPSSTFGIYWRKAETRRSSNDHLQLQDWLEMGHSDRDVDFIIQLAYEQGRRSVSDYSTSARTVDGPATTISVWKRDRLSDRYSISELSADVRESFSSDLGLDISENGSDDDITDGETICTTSEVDAFTLDADTAVFQVIGLMEQQLIDNLMREFRYLWDWSSSYNERQDTADGSRSDSNSTLVSRNMQPNSTKSKKRQRRFSGDSEQRKDDDDDGDDSPNNPNTPAPKDTQELDLRFACPYYQRNPQKHKSRSCAGPGWTTVHRVKEHLYRLHALPIRCSRCGTVFTSETLLHEHYRSPDRCDTIDLLDIEGFNKGQEMKLRSRKKSPATSEAEKWRAVYKILFPDDEEDLIPSPYYDSDQTLNHHRRDEFAQIEKYARRELPRLVRRELELRVQRSCSTIEDQLKRELVDIVQHCQSEIFRSYRQTNGSFSSSNHSIDNGGTAHSSTQISESSTSRSSPPNYVSPTMASPAILAASASPLSESVEFRNVFSHPNGTSESGTASSNEYFHTNNSYIYHNQNKANQHEISSFLSSENLGAFTSEPSWPPNFFDGWQEDINNIGNQENVFNNFPPPGDNAI